MRGIRSRICFRVLGVAWIVIAALQGCADGEMMYEKIFGKGADSDSDEYVPLPGSAASGFLSRKLSDEEVDTGSQLEALDVAISDQGQANLVANGLALSGSETAFSASEGAFDVIGGSEKAKDGLLPDTYQKIDVDFLKSAQSLTLADYTSDTVQWGNYTDTKFTIPALDRMPVRDQGRRGTCAAFAGIGLIEAFIIQNSAAQLPFKEIDLSEQRFYYLSKPDSWSDGGSLSAQGSDSGSGFMSSSGDLAGYPAPSDTGGSAYNIPLESSCPYNKSAGSNDLQVPLAEECKSKGVARVSKFSAWGGSIGGFKRIETAQHVYDELRSGKAVVIYTRLSRNWERNEGLVTYAKAGSPGDSSHAAGHAYLAVGARQISETEFPGEGGMCFIVRNSWGKGWGVNGLSCVTLKWFNYWRFPTTFPTVDEVQLVSNANERLTVVNKNPSGAAEPDPATRTDRRGGSIRKRKGIVSIGMMDFLRLPATQLIPWLPSANADRVLREVDPVRLTADDMSYGTLVTDNDQSYKIFYSASPTQFIVRGIVAGDTQQTHGLELTRSGSALITTVEGRGDVTVGEFTEVSGATDGTKGIAVICGKAWASVCDLNYVEDSNELVIGLSALEARRDASAPPYNWETLKIAGYGLEMSRPESSLTRFDLRLISAGKTTEPQRLKLDPLSGGISHKGVSVGSLTEGSLCSGAFREKCRVVTTGGKFDIFQKSGDN